MSLASDGFACMPSSRVVKPGGKATYDVGKIATGLYLLCPLAKASSVAAVIQKADTLKRLPKELAR